jgi:hypothetical protein
MRQKKIIFKMQPINNQYILPSNLSHNEFETHRSPKKIINLVAIGNKVFYLKTSYHS